MTLLDFEDSNVLKSHLLSLRLGPCVVDYFYILAAKKLEIQRGLQTNGVLSGPLNNLHSQVSITNYTKVPIPNPIISEN